MSMSGTTPEGATGLDADELRDAWPALAEEDRVEGFRLLAPADAEDFFLGLDPLGAGGLLLAMPLAERQIWMRQLDPGDAADVLQEVGEDDRDGLFRLLDDVTRREVTALLAYAEDDAGGLMSPRYARLRPVSVDEAISYRHRQARERVETIILRVDTDQRLPASCPSRSLAAQSDTRVRDVMTTDVGGTG